MKSDMRLDLEYGDPIDYDGMNLPEFRRNIDTTIDPVSMQAFAETVQEKVNTCSDLCKLCSPNCHLKEQIRGALNDLALYAFKGALLNIASADWLMAEISNVNLYEKR